VLTLLRRTCGSCRARLIDTPSSRGVAAFRGLYIPPKAKPEPLPVAAEPEPEPVPVAEPTVQVELEDVLSEPTLIWPIPPGGFEHGVVVSVFHDRGYMFLKPGGHDCYFIKMLSLNILSLILPRLMLCSEIGMCF
jgi:hypothetical protein